MLPALAYGVFSSMGAGNLAISRFFPDSVFRNNVLAGADAAKYPAGNFFPEQSVFENGFVDPANGNYQLTPNNPYVTAATDGTAIGVNMEVLLSALAGNGGRLIRAKVKDLKVE